MSTATSIPTDAEILIGVLDSFDAEALSPEAAAAILKLRFDDETIRRIHDLQDQNRRDTISETDRLLLSRYLRVGQLIDILQAKARAAQANPPADE